MSKFMKTVYLYLLVTATCIGVASNAYSANKANAPSADESQAGEVPEDATGNPVIESLIFEGPFDVFYIKSITASSHLTVSVLDCCLAGDHFVQRTFCLHNGKIWDVRGKGHGKISTYSGSTKVFKLGSQPISCITEVRYGEGIAIFPAGMSVHFKVSGAGTVTTAIVDSDSLPSM